MNVREFIQQRLVRPALAVLKQGLTPEKLTASIVAGSYCGFIPAPATSTVVTTAVGLVLRLNQPAAQLMNQAVGPLQIVFFIPYIRIGELMFSEPPLPLSVSQLVDMVQTDAFGMLHTLWTSIWHGIVAWVLLAPPACAFMYAVLKPIVSRLVARFARPALAEQPIEPPTP